MKTILTSDLLSVIKAKNYPLDQRTGKFTPVGIRNSDVAANTFDDKVGYLIKDTDGQWHSELFDATTDPGLYWREHPINVDGAAIIVPGFHKACYKIGLHRGYPAFQQIGKMRYVRDNDKNKVLNFLYKVAGFKYEDAIYATNIHHAADDHKSILDDKWSAGCQVIADPKDFKEMLDTARRSVDYFKLENVFDYILLEIEDFK